MTASVEKQQIPHLRPQLSTRTHREKSRGLGGRWGCLLRWRTLPQPPAPYLEDVDVKVRVGQQRSGAQHADQGGAGALEARHVQEQPVMRIKAQGDQAQRPQSYPGLPLPQPLCQEGQEIQWQGWARFRSMSLAPRWLSGGDLGVFMHTQPWKEDSPTLRMSQGALSNLTSHW